MSYYKIVTHPAEFNIEHGRAWCRDTGRRHQKDAEDGGVEHERERLH